MNLAEQIKERIGESEKGVFSLICNYYVKNGVVCPLPEGVCELEKRDPETGRVIWCRMRYADNSTLIYRYNTNDGQYTLIPYMRTNHDTE